MPQLRIMWSLVRVPLGIFVRCRAVTRAEGLGWCGHTACLN